MYRSVLHPVMLIFYPVRQERQQRNISVYPVTGLGVGNAPRAIG